MMYNQFDVYASLLMKILVDVGICFILESL